MDDSGNAHVVWTEDVTLYYNRLFYRKHSPAGDWGDRKRLSKNVTFNDHPAIIECNGTLHVVWRQSGQEGNSIRHRSYVPEQGWDENLTRIDLGTMSSDPSIAADSDGNLHVAWTDWLSDAENEIAYRGWTEIQGWDSAVTYVTPNDTCWSERPTVACDDTGNVHVVWQDVRHGLWVLYERVLVPGVGWRGEVRISPPGAGASVPHLRAGPAGDLHLAWEDSRDLCCAVYYRRWETQESSIPGGLDLSNASTDLSASVLPNPSAGSVRIALRPLALLSDVSVDIYDLRGRLVCHLPVCDGLAVWYGLNGNGASVAPGTYFVSVSTPSRAISKKIVLLE
jgi:hypothetical protein